MVSNEVEVDTKSEDGFEVITKPQLSAKLPTSIPSQSSMSTVSGWLTSQGLSGMRPITMSLTWSPTNELAGSNAKDTSPKSATNKQTPIDRSNVIQIKLTVPHTYLLTPNSKTGTFSILEDPSTWFDITFLEKRSMALSTALGKQSIQQTFTTYGLPALMFIALWSYI